VVRAVEYWKENPEEANKIMAEKIGGWLKDPKLFAETLTGIKYYDREMNERAFVSGQVRQMVVDRIKVWKKLGKLDWDPEPMEMFDPQFAGNL
jgi:NitT/TauT family transport system substrate-binding protein